MNQQNLTLLGRATQEAQMLTSKAGKEFSKFSVAINEFRGKDAEPLARFYEVVSFQRQPKSVAKQVKKGDIVFVTGKPDVYPYESRSGELKAKFSVAANYIYNHSVPNLASKFSSSSEDLSEDLLVSTEELDDEESLI